MEVSNFERFLFSGLNSNVLGRIELAVFSRREPFLERMFITVLLWASFTSKDLMLNPMQITLKAMFLVQYLFISVDDIFDMLSITTESNCVYSNTLTMKVNRRGFRRVEKQKCEAHSFVKRLT